MFSCEAQKISSLEKSATFGPPEGRTAPLFKFYHFLKIEIGLLAGHFFIVLVKKILTNGLQYGSRRALLQRLEEAIQRYVCESLILQSVKRFKKTKQRVQKAVRILPELPPTISFLTIRIFSHCQCLYAMAQVT